MPAIRQRINSVPWFMPMRARPGTSCTPGSPCSASTTRTATASAVACTNAAESYFSRLRRGDASGHHHHIAGAVSPSLCPPQARQPGGGPPPRPSAGPPASRGNSVVRLAICNAGHRLTSAATGSALTQRLARLPLDHNPPSRSRSIVCFARLSEPENSPFDQWAPVVIDRRERLRVHDLFGKLSRCQWSGEHRAARVVDQTQTLTRTEPGIVGSRLPAGISSGRLLDIEQLHFGRIEMRQSGAMFDQFLLQVAHHPASHPDRLSRNAPMTSPNAVLLSRCQRQRQ